MDELYPFCSELYSEEGEVENDLQSIPLLQTHVPKLSQCMRELCEGELTFKDCFSVLSAFQNSKKNGYDGLTVYLYIGNFWQSC